MLMSSGLIAYLAGLIDGEGYVGVNMQRHDHTRSGYDFAPIVRISLNFELPALSAIREQLGFGKVFQSKTRPMASLTFRKRADVIKMLDLIEPEVRLPSSKARLPLVKRIMTILGTYKHLSNEEFAELKQEMIELRRMSKRTKGIKRIWH